MLAAGGRLGHEISDAPTASSRSVALGFPVVIRGSDLNRRATVNKLARKCNPASKSWHQTTVFDTEPSCFLPQDQSLTATLETIGKLTL